MVFDETCALLSEIYGRQFHELIITDVVVGLFITAIRLSDGSTGIAGTMHEAHHKCVKGSRDYGDFTPLRIKGEKVSALLDSSKSSALSLSLKWSALNALSSGIIESGRYNVIAGGDPVKLLGDLKGKKITLVGAFQSYIRYFQDSGFDFSVLELNEYALLPDQRIYFESAGRFEKLLPESDVVIITGQALVNGTMDQLLDAVSPAAEVIVTGPTCGTIPDILFKKGVTITGGPRIKDKDLLFNLATEGGTTYHLYNYCAEKISILRADGAQVK